MQDAEDLARASRVLGMDPTGSELVRNPDHVKHSFAEYDESDETQTTPDRYYDAPEEVDNESDTAMDGVDSNPGDMGAFSPDHQNKPETLYVSEADIARIVPRVITHRLRVRNGPQDEVLSSTVFGATFSNYMDGGWDGDQPSYGYPRTTVKDILVGILGDV
jgi:hypothetical protein